MAVTLSTKTAARWPRAASQTQVTGLGASVRREGTGGHRAHTSPRRSSMAMKRSRTIAGSILLAVLIGALLMTGAPAGAQPPKYGGELIFPVPSEPPSY